MRSAGLRHQGGRDKAYQEDTTVEANEEAAVRRKQMWDTFKRELL